MITSYRNAGVQVRNKHQGRELGAQLVGHSVVGAAVECDCLMKSVVWSKQPGCSMESFHDCRVTEWCQLVDHIVLGQGTDLEVLSGPCVQCELSG